MSGWWRVGIAQFRQGRCGRHLLADAGQRGHSHPSSVARRLRWTTRALGARLQGAQIVRSVHESNDGIHECRRSYSSSPSGAGTR